MIVHEIINDGFFSFLSRPRGRLLFILAELLQGYNPLLTSRTRETTILLAAIRNDMSEKGKRRVNLENDECRSR